MLASLAVRIARLTDVAAAAFQTPTMRYKQTRTNKGLEGDNCPNPELDWAGTSLEVRRFLDNLPDRHTG